METTNTVAGCRLDGIEYHRPRLDDVFVAHTGRSLKDEPLLPQLKPNPLDLFISWEQFSHE